MIDSLELRLPSVLDRAVAGAAPKGIRPSTSADFYRQYLGIVHRGGRRSIYVNGFHEQYVAARSYRRNGDVASDTLMWRTEPISVCDGGSHFFGVEFDPQSNEFGRIEFNDRVNR
jgi:hypothetical protein